MSVDFTGWKSGDRGVMEVEFVFEEEQQGDVRLTISAISVDTVGISKFYDPSKIKSITRIDPPIKVGDRVRPRDYHVNGEVVGIHNGEAAVAWDDGDKTWIPVFNLEHLP